MRRRTLCFALAIARGGCDEGAALRIVVVSDLVAVEEVTDVRVRFARSGDANDDRARQLALSPDDLLFAGVDTGAFEVPPGARAEPVVELLDERTIVLARPIAIEAPSAGEEEVRV